MTLRVAVAGLGFMGATHARAWLEIPEATLAAVISNDERKLAGDLSSVGGNLGLAFEPLDFSRARIGTPVRQWRRWPGENMCWWKSRWR
jgi:hypothetical protein